jgi:hypothetical protein
MRQQIDEKQFKTSLQRNEKKVQKKREMRNVLQVLDGTSTDIILRFKHYLETCPANQVEYTILEELEFLVEYVNENLEEISETYGSEKKVVTEFLKLE